MDVDFGVTRFSICHLGSLKQLATVTMQYSCSQYQALSFAMYFAWIFPRFCGTGSLTCHYLTAYHKPSLNELLLSNALIIQPFCLPAKEG